MEGHAPIPDVAPMNPVPLTDRGGRLARRGAFR
jgi:hypothetical protein